MYGDPSKLTEKPPKKPRNADLARSISLATQMAVIIGACIVVGVLLGQFLDSHLGTSPWLLLLFSFLGIGAAFKSMYDMSKRF